MELITKIGTILGYISTAIALFALIKAKMMADTDRHIAKVAGKEHNEEIHHSLNDRMEALETKFAEFIERDNAFKDRLDKHVEAQTAVDRKLMANIIETTYYQNRDRKTLDMNQFKRICDVYEIYHSDEIHGNSYISELFEEMMTWKREG